MAEIKLEGYGTFELPEHYKLKEMRTIERYSGGEMQGYELSKIAGMIHVAIARAKPELSFDEIQAVVDEIDVEDLDKILSASQEAGQSPPASETESEPSGSNESSSGGSATSSDATPEIETPPSSGSPDLAGFRSFHEMSAS